MHATRLERQTSGALSKDPPPALIFPFPGAGFHILCAFCVPLVRFSAPEKADLEIYGIHLKQTRWRLECTGHAHTEIMATFRDLTHNKLLLPQLYQKNCWKSSR